jgi:restriction endonuclease S subunit
MFSLKAYPKSQ